MIWIIFIALIFFFGYIHQSNKNDEIKNNLILKDLGYDINEKIEMGKYIGGHPNINEQINLTVILPKGNSLDIMLAIPLKVPVKMGEIEFDQIKNIFVEDQSSIEKRVTVGRLLMTGIFAFAWKKDKKNELAYLLIEWNDSRFDHETIFEFEGVGSMQKANIARNKLIKIIR